MFEWLSNSSKPLREAEAQTSVDAETAKMSLYHFTTCPFCVRVRHAISKLQLDIEMKNTHESQDFRNELLEGGGQSMVPCLRLEKDDGSVEWMYESKDIVDYLAGRFAPEKTA
jgi:glutathione S-transferase